MSFKLKNIPVIDNARLRIPPSSISSSAFVTGGSSVTYSVSNRRVQSSNWNIVPLNNVIPLTGKWFAEFDMYGGEMGIGLSTLTSPANAGEYLGLGGGPLSFGQGDGIRNNGIVNAVNNTGLLISNTAVITKVGVSVDRSTGTVRFYVNGVLHISNFTLATLSQNPLTFSVSPFPRLSGAAYIEFNTTSENTPSGFNYMP